jgi:hypothetical protein
LIALFTTKKRRGGRMTTKILKGKRNFVELEKNDLLSKAMQILTCGDDKIVNAFSARVKTILKAVRSEKKKTLKQLLIY